MVVSNRSEQKWTLKFTKNDCLAIQNCHAETGFDDLKKSTQKARNKIYAKLGSKDPYVAKKIL